MNDVIKKLQNLDYQGCQKFIQYYGTIHDVQLAQRSLILNPTTWNVLDDTLKQLPEVIAYYIPVGYYEDIVYDEIQEIDYKDILVPKGFIYIEKDATPYLIPDITWPEKFGEEQYLEILSYIPVKQSTCISYSDVIDRNEHPSFKNCEMYSKYDNNERVNKRPRQINRTYNIYDRTKILEAIKQFYNNIGKAK